ncbi:MAG: nicotinate-nucleotide adenylyltransferase [Bacillota bacterium]|nr:nicotinate-nucleotide adenylyltransferase [Bacillota bacterium]
MSGKLENGNNFINKIGIFGGSFDPIHLGHTGLAEDAMKAASLDKVVFIPARLQPFKLDKQLTTGEARVEMIKLAVKGKQGFEISTYELDEEGISYSYLTMRAMQKQYGPDSKLYFITGTDAFLKIDKWKNAEEMLNNYSFIIGTRPGYKQEELLEHIKTIKDTYGTDVVNIENRQIDVSSTEIRNNLEKGISCSGLISPDVERYITDNGLYR